MSLVPSLTSPSYGASAASSTSANGAGAAAKPGGLANAMSSAASTTTAAPSSDPASSTTVTLSPQALSMSHAASLSSPSPAPAPAPSAAQGAAAASDGTSIYDELKHGLAAAVGDVGDAITGTASWIGHGVESVVSGADTLVHGALDLPFAVVAEAANAAGAVLDAI